MTVARKRARRTKKSSIPRGVGTLVGAQPGFPKRLRFKHKYVDNFTVTDGGVTPFTLRMRCNGMFDPSQSTAGHQPMYYDNIGLIYNHWVVKKSHIKWTIVPYGSTTQFPYRVTTFINDDTNTTSIDANTLAEYPSSNSAICAGGINPDKLVMRQTYDSVKTFGSNPVGNSALKGSNNADPTEQQFFQLFFSSTNTGNAVSAVIIAEVIYEAEWFELKDIDQS